MSFNLSHPAITRLHFLDFRSKAIFNLCCPCSTPLELLDRHRCFLVVLRVLRLNSLSNKSWAPSLEKWNLLRSRTDRLSTLGRLDLDIWIPLVFCRQQHFSDWLLGRFRWRNHSRTVYTVGAWLALGLDRRSVWVDQRAVLLVQRQSPCHLWGWRLKVTVQSWEHFCWVLALKRIDWLKVAL